MIKHLTSLPRNTKRAVALTVDILVLAFSYAFALFVRYEQVFIPRDPDVYWAFLLSLPVSLLLFMRLGLYRAVVRYMALSALLVITSGVLTSAFVLWAAVYILGAGVPISVIITYALMSLILVGGLRLLMRALYEQTASRTKTPVMIYGAGSAGRQLAQSLMNGKEFHPVAFLDDDPTLHKSSILGLRVCCPKHIQEAISHYHPKMVLLAIPSAPRSRRKEILEYLEPFKVTVQTIPGMSDVVSGKMRIDELQDVRIEDLLGRDPVEPRKKLMEVNIRGKAVLVTGAGGSIGAELCRQIVQYEPSMLVLVEVSEYNLYAIEKELQAYVHQHELDVLIKPVLSSIQNQNRLTRTMQRFHIETVYHAAAYKHVPMVEFNIVEGVRNNIFGTFRTAQAAITARVKDFVLISTDKAVRPTNVMGATKRFAELVLQGLASRKDHQTHFSMVRFGNVLGSSGSVVPLFRRQIAEGGPVTVTHPDITRYFMTIPEAAQLVIQAGAMGSIAARAEGNNGGQVFVLDMGEPVKIVELAQKLIRLMGLEIKSKENPHGDIEIVYTGLRPGEKLYEELLIGENVLESEHKRIMTARELSLPWREIELYLEQLDTLCFEFKVHDIHTLLQQAPLAFQPTSAICDLTWQPKLKTKVADMQDLDDELSKN